MPSAADRIAFGEVTTPDPLVDMLLSHVPASAYAANTRWLDAGAGTGCFSRGVHRKLTATGIDASAAWHQIHMSELNPERVEDLAPLVAAGAHLHEGDFTAPATIGGEFDAVVGNPPYVVTGRKKVPTLSGESKSDDGKTAWPAFVRRGLELLRPGGHLAFIIPALWMRPDKAGVHDMLLSQDVVFCRAFGCGETAKVFAGGAQTPTCAVVVCKRPSSGSIGLFCSATNEVVRYPLFSLRESVPLHAASVLRRLRRLVRSTRAVQARKTNMPPASTTAAIDTAGNYEGVRTCVLDGLAPRLVAERATVPFPYHGESKLVLAHKMYGFPHHDHEGRYGISRRDNYVVLESENGDLSWIKELLETRLARCVFVACRYRMRYLEKQAFEFLPDPSSVPGFPRPVTDAALAAFLGLSAAEAAHVLESVPREYGTLA